MEKIENLLGLGNFKGISAQPIDPVMTTRHSARFAVLPVPVKRPGPPQKICDGVGESKIRKEETRDRRLSDQSRAIKLFDFMPPTRFSTLIVVNREK